MPRRAGSPTRRRRSASPRTPRSPTPSVVATGDELLAAADVLRRQPRLRRALSDPSRSPEDRTALFRRVLTGKVGDETLGLPRRWCPGAGRRRRAAHLRPRGRGGGAARRRRPRR